MRKRKKIKFRFNVYYLTCIIIKNDVYTGKHYSVDLNRYFFMSRLNLLVL